MDKTTNSIFRTINGKELRIIRELGSGTQGTVYEAEYETSKEHVAFKLIDLSSLVDSAAFTSGVKKLLKVPSPSPMFLWPVDIVEQHNDSHDIFGYIMMLVPSGFYKLSHVLTSRDNQKKFRTFRVNETCALNICGAFNCLHANLGASFMDINDDGIFVNPVTGDVLIGDCDNIRPNGGKSEVCGTPTFMAPELVTGKVPGPSVQTDYYSVSLLIFLLLTNQHPLEGKRFFATTLMTREQDQLQYGSNPLFIMDPIRHENAPDPTLQRGFLQFWNRFPAYLRNTFTEEFSHRKLIENPLARRSETDWISILMRFRSETVFCPHCRKIHFAPMINRCERCDAPLAYYKVKASGSRYPMLGVPGLVLYRPHFNFCDTMNRLDRTLFVGTMADGRTGIKNLSDSIIKLGGTANGVLHSGDTTPIKDGLIVEAFGGIVGFTKVD